MNTSELSSSLRLAVSSLHKILRRRSGMTDIYSMTEMETIGQLMHAGKLMPTQLASLTRVTTQTMSQILSKMEEQGIIKRTPSKEDRRRVYVSLTPLGKKFVEKARYERDELLKRTIETALSKKEMELLEKALPVLNKLTATL